MLLVPDIDHFKKFNGDFGHKLGDKVLKSVVGTARDTILCLRPDFPLRRRRICCYFEPDKCENRNQTSRKKSADRLKKIILLMVIKNFKPRSV